MHTHAIPHLMPMFVEGEEVKKPSKTQALERIRKAITQVDTLMRERYDSPAFDKWLRDTEIAIGYTFGENARHVQDFKNVSYSPGIVVGGGGDEQFQRPYVRGLRTAKSVLESMLDEIEEYWEKEAGVAAASEDSSKSATASKNVFIIHGHDDGAKETVARFVSKLGLNPIVLHEKANEGRTVIEKFEFHAKVAYAIAVLTPDDFGAEKTQRDHLHARARQNVVFEFGYFMGSLGRKRACGVVKGDIELPSDYSGVLYIPLDVEGAWRMKLIRELKASGLDVDANLAL